MRLMRQERRRSAWIGNILYKYTKKAIRFVDSCTGKFSDTQACLIFSKNKKFMDCEADPNCVKKGMLQLTLLYARNVFSKTWDID